jgi:Zn-dependent oligopeptidase
LGEGNIKNEATRLRALRDERPDLAARVNDAELTLDNAIALAKSEAEAVKQRRWAATKNLVEGVQLLDRSLDTAADLLNEYDPVVAQQMGETITTERLMRVAQFATALSQHLAERTAPSSE